MEAEEEFRITDFRMAGFLLVRGVRFMRTSMDEKGEVSFVFQAEGRKAADTLNEYPGSAEQRYDAACKTMHDFTRLKIANQKRSS